MRVLAPAILAIVLLSTPAFGQAPPLSTTWQAGPGATGDDTYLGVIDAPTNGTSVSQTALLSISGWFVDTSADGWPGADDIQVYAGSMDTGKLVAHATLGVNRPDVASALHNPYWAGAGWQATLDPGALAVGQNTLSIYAHTPSKGWWSLQVGVLVGQTFSSSGEPLAEAPAAHGPPPTLTVDQPMDGEPVSIRVRSFPITGTARDAAAGARGIDWVEVWLNGEANSDTGVILGEADLNGDGSWTLPFDPGAHPPIDSNLYIYAHSSLNGKKTLVVRHFSLIDRPL